MLADLVGRATRAVNEVQPAAGYERDASPTFPPGRRSTSTPRGGSTSEPV
jgi:hypothetical protein